MLLSMNEPLIPQPFVTRVNNALSVVKQGIDSLRRAHMGAAYKPWELSRTCRICDAPLEQADRVTCCAKHAPAVDELVRKASMVSK